MSYRVEYTWDLKWEKKKDEWGIRLVIVSGFFFVLFLLSVGIFWEQGREVLWQLVFPGDAVLTWNALEDFAGDIQQGIPLRFAAENFCQELVNSGY